MSPKKWNSFILLVFKNFVCGKIHHNDAKKTFSYLYITLIPRKIYIFLEKHSPPPKKTKVSILLTNIEAELLADLPAYRARYSSDGGYWGGLDDRNGLQVDCAGTRTEIHVHVFTQRICQNLVNIEQGGLDVDNYFTVKFYDGCWKCRMYYAIWLDCANHQKKKWKEGKIVIYPLHVNQ